MRIKWNLELVKKYVIENSNCKVLSINFVNTKSNLLFQCECGNKFETKLDTFIRQNKRQCDKCTSLNRKNKMKYDLKYIRDFIKENSDCVLLSSEYINNKENLQFKCVCGNIFETTFNEFYNGNKRQCNNCGDNIRRLNQIKYTLEEVSEMFENHGYKLISKEYLGTDHYLEFICLNHPNNIQTTRIVDISRSNHVCKYCQNESKRGENNPNFNPNLTNVEREKGRNILGEETIRTWRKGVYERDNYTCQCCRTRKSGVFNAHHLNGYNWDRENRFNIDNGVTLCEDCHKDFHSKYGYGHNTKEQFNKWILKNRKNYSILKCFHV